MLSQWRWKQCVHDCPGGPVGKNPPVNAGDTGNLIWGQAQVLPTGRIPGSLINLTVEKQESQRQRSSHSGKGCNFMQKSNAG
ncbi:hypothetical protein JEQ12_013991 [Ovis aries]|uniref:Uncharacterized protein n=1 Tax=Ovis aries TaxID=9940 RepID=A0A836A992_SHEEP|nr:hypothetical protein JEQ12_013991 [Ovis aries]